MYIEINAKHDTKSEIQTQNVKLKYNQIHAQYFTKSEK